MKKIDLLLRDYVTRLSTDNLRFVYERVTNRLGGDLAEVVEFFSQEPNLDKWLSSAKSGIELFDMVDYISTFVCKEYGRRIPELIV